MLCKSAGQRFLKMTTQWNGRPNPFSMWMPFPSAEAGARSHGPLAKCHQEAKAPDICTVRRTFSRLTPQSNPIQIKSNQWISRNCPRDQAYIKPMVTLSLGGSYLRISIAYKSRTAPQGATTDHTFDAITAWRLSWRNGTDCKAVVVFSFSSWLPMPPAADWIASSKQASASYRSTKVTQLSNVGKLEKRSRSTWNSWQIGKWMQMAADPHAKG